MARIVSLSDAQTLVGADRFAAYAALDATGTLEIFNVLRPRLDADQERIYRWSMAQQGPAFTMARRGILVDKEAHAAALKTAKIDLASVTNDIVTHPLVEAHWDGKELETGVCAVPRAPDKKGRLPKSGTEQRHKWPKGWKDDVTALCERCGAMRHKPSPLNPASDDQVKRLFYDVLKVAPQYNKDGKVSVDDDSLERIERDGRALAPDGKRRKLDGLSLLAHLFREHRDRHKQVGFLSAKLSISGRYHSNFNVGAAWTGRWSSSEDPFGRGGNSQNIAEKHRHIFIADPGHEMFYSDLKTAESLKVAFMAGDTAYIRAHDDDVHTWVCRELWPELPWTGDIKADKAIASSNYPEWDNVPGHDYRFQSKRIQHGTNYGLTPFGIAQIAHIPIKAAKAAQRNYFIAFPEIPKWHIYMRERIEAQLPLYNALRRVVRLFGRPKDSHTYKQGLAFGPQGGVGDVLNLALWRVWKFGDPHLILLLAQVHDAILGQYPIEARAEALAFLDEMMKVPVPVTDFKGVTREMTIKNEIAVGKNWGKASDKNPHGLKEVK